jgi:hypothetical protein
MVTDHGAADGLHNSMMAGVMPGYPMPYASFRRTTAEAEPAMAGSSMLKAMAERLDVFTIRGRREKEEHCIDLSFQQAG